MTKISLNGQLPSSTGDAAFEESIGTSQLGNPIFDDITFPAGSYLTLKNIEIPYQELSLQSVRYVVSMQKNIVRTAVSGRNGNVKEYNADGDYIIRAQASISVNDPVFPTIDFQKFIDLSRIPQQIPIVSKILNNFFEIDDVVLSEFSVDPQNGAGNVIINFVLESDQDFDLADFIVRQR